MRILSQLFGRDVCTMDKESDDMEALSKNIKSEPRPIPKTQIGLNSRQKDILKSFVGKAPKFPVDLNTVREWEKYGED